MGTPVFEHGEHLTGHECSQRQADCHREVELAAEV